MRIVALADAWLPHAGGSRVYYHHLYKELSNRGWRTTVITKHVPGAKEFDRGWDGAYKIIRRFQPAGSWKYHEVQKLLGPLAHAIAAVIRCRPAAVHACDIYPQGLIALILQSVTGLPYLTYAHGEEITQMDQQRLEPILRDAVYRNATTIIAASAFAVENLIRIGIARERIEKINPGVDHQRFSPGPPSIRIVERYGLGGRRVLLTVARLIPRKGHAAVLKALTQLLPRMPDLTYVIAGTGPEETHLRVLASELGIAHAVRFAGYVPDDILPDLYRSADVFIMPNSEITGDIEGFGMVFLESNACGKPVIAGRSGGTAESVIDGVNGFRIASDDIDGLSQRIECLMQDLDLRMRLGNLGLERARREFNWANSGERLHYICRASQLDACAPGKCARD
jgi:phosphatidylinositol alpha-1,6-mannosyltransferase